ncbi:MAG: hypothetical protein L0Y79_04030 [Chlorobi bacterium]|nr:hypothetical protein [Chlorobiota bacterium]
MSIVACVKVIDGIALAADSVTQIWGKGVSGQAGVMKTYHFAKKIFQLGTLPIGILTYGIGNIGHRSIESLVRDFYNTPLDAKSVEEITNEFYTYIKRIYEQTYPPQVNELQQQPNLGIYIAGYSERDRELGNDWGMEYEFILPVHTASIQVREKEKTGASWRGISNIFSRLFFGYEPLLKKTLIDGGRSEEEINKLLGSFAVPIVFDGMPVQDAINFVTFIIKTTIGVLEFSIGPPSCGEPIDVAVITPVGGFEWIAEKKYITS